ncbi:MAG: dihydroorotate dehydrogenase electron transfer subunit [Deltaproteobacteria bacterium]|nr:dihydroorotate dehydrogenase electron transfer subunit [Deltaproteobacteria bacterium]
MIEQNCKVVSNDLIAADTYRMTLDCPEIAADAQPGQFVMLKVTHHPIADPLLRRPFSIAGITARGHLLVLYRVVGRGTRLMASFGPEDRCWVLGPLGTGFELPKKNGGSLLVAGGMGIAPLGFLAQRVDSPRHLFTGYGSADQIISMEDLGLSQIDARVATEDGTAGHHGMVTDLLLAHIETPASHQEKPGKGAGTVVYACGPLPMLKAVAALALKEGISCQVSLESVMACGLGACQGCAVRAAPESQRQYHHVCQDGPVFDVRALDWDGI